MKLTARAPLLRCAVVPLLSSIILVSLAGCGGSSATSPPKIGGAKVDPEVEAQNRAAIETYNSEKKK